MDCSECIILHCGSYLNDTVSHMYVDNTGCRPLGCVFSSRSFISLFKLFKYAGSRVDCGLIWVLFLEVKFDVSGWHNALLRNKVLWKAGSVLSVMYCSITVLNFAHYWPINWQYITSVVAIHTVAYAVSACISLWWCLWWYGCFSITFLLFFLTMNCVLPSACRMKTTRLRMVSHWRRSTRHIILSSMSRRWRSVYS